MLNIALGLCSIIGAGLILARLPEVGCYWFIFGGAISTIYGIKKELRR